MQALFLTSEVWAQYYSSTNDLGAPAVNALYGPQAWDDSGIYGGQLWSTVNPSAVTPYFFPSSPTGRALGSLMPTSTRDANDNGVSVMKLQYQHAFSSDAFIRAYGYMLYSNWYIWGPNTAAQPYYGAELADYEIPDHTFGYNISFVDQLNDKHLLTASTNFTGSNLQRYYVGYINGNYQLTNFVVGTNPATAYCADPTTGASVPCYGDPSFNGKSGSWGSATPGSTCGTPGFLPTGIGTLNCPVPIAPATPGSWYATNNTFYGALNQVHPRFTGVSLSDQWRPNDQLNVNLGAARSRTFTISWAIPGITIRRASFGSITTTRVLLHQPQPARRSGPERPAACTAAGRQFARLGESRSAVRIPFALATALWIYL